MLPHPSDIDRELARRYLARFIGQAWPVLEPATPFIAGVHTLLICSYLERVARGQLRRLLINVPPRQRLSRSS